MKTCRNGTPSVAWESIDWKLTDAEIARRHGVSPQRVGVKRKKMGFPASNYRYHRLVPVYEAVSTHPLTLPQRLAEQTGIPVTQIYYVRGVLSIRGNLNRDRYPWRQMNWELPNVDLARIWKAPPSKVCKVRCL